MLESVDYNALLFDRFDFKHTALAGYDGALIATFVTFFSVLVVLAIFNVHLSSHCLMGR